jgi:uncharacterized protein (TIGR02246 family)
LQHNYKKRGKRVMRHLLVLLLLAAPVTLVAAETPEVSFVLSAGIDDGEPVKTTVSVPVGTSRTVPAVGSLKYQIEVKAPDKGRLVTTVQLVAGDAAPPLQRAVLYGWWPADVVRSGAFTVCGTRVLLDVPVPAQPARCADLPPVAPMEPSNGCIECAGAYEGMPAVLSAHSRIAPVDAPGEPLVLTGRTLGTDGRPRTGVIVYAFQTDHTGVYPTPAPRRSALSQTHGAYRGWSRSDAQGRYRFDTIRPGGYPDSGEPQHIHMVVIEPGCWAAFIEDVHFGDDPRLKSLTPDDRKRDFSGAGGSGITTPLRDAAGKPQRVVRDIQLGRNMEGYPGCLAAAQQAGRDDRADVESATQRWISAFNRKSTDEIVALYAPDAVFQGTSSPVLRDSPALVRDYFKGLANLGNSAMATGDHRIQVFGDTAVSSGYYTRTSADNGKITQAYARFTFVYARRGGRWLIVAHHSSALP